MFGDISSSTEQNTENVKSDSLNRLMNELDAGDKCREMVDASEAKRLLKLEK